MKISLLVIALIMAQAASGQTKLQGDICWTNIWLDGHPIRDKPCTKPAIKMCSGLNGRDCEVNGEKWPRIIVRSRSLSDLMPLVEPLPLPRECPNGCPEWHPADGTNVPMDVPAIQEEQDVLTGTYTCKAAPECVGKDWSCNLVICSHDTEKVKRTTCADKSRVLLTDESGNRHCIKF